LALKGVEVRKRVTSVGGFWEKGRNGGGSGASGGCLSIGRGEALATRQKEKAHNWPIAREEKEKRTQIDKSNAQQGARREKIRRRCSFVGGEGRRISREGKARSMQIPKKEGRMTESDKKQIRSPNEARSLNTNRAKRVRISEKKEKDTHRNETGNHLKI